MTVSSSAGLERLATTDAEGRWEVTDLPAGRFNITASKAGFLTLEYGQRRPLVPGTPIFLGNAQTIEKLDLALPRGSVITGRITDESGEPIAQAVVRAMRYEFLPDGQRRLTTAGSDSTDDRGEFRLYGLMPGEYLVQGSVRALVIANGTPATSSGSQPETFASTYFPGTPNLGEAQSVSLSVGQEMTVQFRLVPAGMSRVVGVVVNAAGRPVAGAPLSILTPTGDGGSMSASVGVTASDGSFTVANVSSGEHSITVNPWLGAEAVEFAFYPFVASGEVVSLRVQTSPGASIRGRVIWEGSAPRPPGRMPLRVIVLPASGGIHIAPSTTPPTGDGSVNADGTFRLAGVWGKAFVSVIGNPAGWVLKSVTVDGEDIRDTAVDLTARAELDNVRVVLSDRRTVLAGRVTDGRGSLSKDYVVVVLPSGLKEGLSPTRYIQIARPDQAGRFVVWDLPEGRYTATALEWIEQGRQYAPEFQRELRKAGHEFTLREGQSLTLDLSITPDL